MTIPTDRISLPTWIAIVAALVAVAVSLYAVGRNASEGNQQAIAFVSLPQIMQESEIGKSITTQVTPKQKAMQDEAQAKLKEFKKEQEDINKQRSSLSAEEFGAKTKELQQKIDDWNIEIQKRQAALNDAANTAIQGMQQALREQVTAIAAENHFAAVLPEAEAFFTDKKLDVTAEAIRRLDKKVSKVDLKL